MTFSRNRALPILRKNNRQSGNRQAAPVKYYVHWAFPTAFIAVVVLFFIAYLCQCAQLITVQYRIGELKTEKRTLQKEQKNLTLSIENLESLERIERIAINDIKMIYPKRRVALNLDRTTTTAQLETGDSVATP